MLFICLKEDLLISRTRNETLEGQISSTVEVVLFKTNENRKPNPVETLKLKYIPQLYVIQHVINYMTDKSDIPRVHLDKQNIILSVLLYYQTV